MQACSLWSAAQLSSTTECHLQTDDLHSKVERHLEAKLHAPPGTDFGMAGIAKRKRHLQGKETKHLRHFRRRVCGHPSDRGPFHNVRPPCRFVGHLCCHGPLSYMHNGNTPLLGAVDRRLAVSVTQGLEPDAFCCQTTCTWLDDVRRVGEQESSFCSPSTLREDVRG